MAKARIIDLNSFHVEIIGIFGIQKSGSYVWDIHPGITFSQDIDFVSLKIKSINEIFPEALELICYIKLICDIFGATAKSGSDGLINVNNIGKVGPTKTISPWEWNIDS